MNFSEKQLLIEFLRQIQREKHRKKLKSAQNQRYYQRHRDKILLKRKQFIKIPANITRNL